jgi:hypothetical protein
MPKASCLVLLVLLPGLGSANDFPTQARVEFVLGCMNENGEQSYDTLYPCVCMIDRIAGAMSHPEFAQARVFTQLRSTPGERGGLFRDPEQARVLAEKLETAMEEGRAACFVRSERPERPPASAASSERPPAAAARSEQPPAAAVRPTADSD